MSKSAYLEQLNSSVRGKDEERCAVLQMKGFTIYIGANALSNEKLLSGHRHHPECLVFHAFGAKGSYVVLCSPDPTKFNDEIIRYSAETSLRHSRSELRSVTYGFLKDIYKPEDAPIGVFKWASSGVMEL